MISLLARIAHSQSPFLEPMLDSIRNQETTDWELVLVTEPGQVDTLSGRVAGDARIRVITRPAGESLAQTCNTLFSELRRWIGFIGEYDQLIPDALGTMAASIYDHPAARVHYSDEVSISRWGKLSRHRTKMPLDPVRLMSHDYLRDLVLLDRDWLSTHGGFDPLASDGPRHDAYLRLLGDIGSIGFQHVPKVLYQRYRYRLDSDDDLLPGYDLDGVRRHLERQGVEGKVYQKVHSLDIRLVPETRHAVTALALLDPCLPIGMNVLDSLSREPVYPGLAVRALCQQDTPENTRQRYRDVCAGRGYGFRRAEGNWPEILNQELSTIDTPMTLFIGAMALPPMWLHTLQAWSILPHVAAVTGQIITPIRQRDTGLPWDARGSLNQLAVPHQVSMASGQALLVDTRVLQSMGGLESAYPTKWGEDLVMRLASMGKTCICTPQVHFWGDVPSPTESELKQFREAWSDWQDPYGIYQLP